jgi:hypothetical protein
MAIRPLPSTPSPVEHTSEAPNSATRAGQLRYPMCTGGQASVPHLLALRSRLALCFACCTRILLRFWLCAFVRALIPCRPCSSARRAWLASTFALEFETDARTHAYMRRQAELCWHVRRQLRHCPFVVQLTTATDVTVLLVSCTKKGEFSRRPRRCTDLPPAPRRQSSPQLAARPPLASPSGASSACCSSRSHRCDCL